MRNSYNLRLQASENSASIYYNKFSPKSQYQKLILTSQDSMRNNTLPTMPKGMSFAYKSREANRYSKAIPNNSSRRDNSSFQDIPEHDYNQPSKDLMNNLTLVSQTFSPSNMIASRNAGNERQSHTINSLRHSGEESTKLKLSSVEKHGMIQSYLQSIQSPHKNLPGLHFERDNQLMKLVPSSRPIIPKIQRQSFQQQQPTRNHNSHIPQMSLPANPGNFILLEPQQSRNPPIHNILHIQNFNQFNGPASLYNTQQLPDQG